MGIYASADLCFGVDCGDQNPLCLERQAEDEEPIEDLGEYLALLQGHTNPWTRMPPGFSHKERSKFPEFDVKVREWCGLVKSLSEDAPVCLEFYGGPDWTGYVLRLSGNRFSRSCFETPDKIDLPEQPTLDEIKAAIDFCEKWKLPSFEDAGWLLLPSYG